MELIGYYGSPFVRRVGATLHLYGMDFTLRSLSPRDDAAALRALNPLLRIPALVLDDGDVLIDSTCIVDWLDEQAGDGALVPRAGLVRRRVLRLVALAQGAAEKYVAVYYESTRRPPSHLWPPWLERLEGQVAAGLGALEEAAGAPWLFGTAMTHADVLTACAILAMRGDMPHLAPQGRYPRLDAVVERSEGLAAFAMTRP